MGLQNGAKWAEQPSAGEDLMKVGMNLLLWTANVTEEHYKLLEDIKAWGFDGVEVPMFTPEASDWGALAKVCDDLGLGRTAVSVMPEGKDLISDDPALRRAGIDFIKQLVEAGGELGIELLNGPIYTPLGKKTGGGPSEDENARYVEAYQELGPFAAQHNLAFGVEPLNRFETYFLNSQEQASALTDAVGHPNVGHMYDTFHANIEEKSLRGAIQTGGKRINFVHISANDRATPGEDHIDYAGTFDALKEIGYDGWLTIEAFGSRLSELAAATCIWRKMAPSEEHIARKGLAMIQELWNH
jgi:D-psicose/D-tagatose/L-ribulose 3-epimerase